jgi:flagellar P-ring protein FlgI
MPIMIRRLALLFAALLALLPVPAAAERVRDLGQFQSVRSNQLTGYGIVVGLDGSGDDNFAYLTQAMRGVSGRLGLQLAPGVSPALKNAAAVIITAELPAFAKPGQRIPVTVSTMGKAKSLRGGALVLTPLYGADGQIYAMAQGNLAVGGLGVSGKDGSKLTVNVPTVGRIADGATVEQAVASNFDFLRSAALEPLSSRFPHHLAGARRDQFGFYPGMAQIEDGVTLALFLPPGANSRAEIMARIEMLDIQRAERAAKVVDQQPHRHDRDLERGASVPGGDQPRQPGGADRRGPAGRPARSPSPTAVRRSNPTPKSAASQMDSVVTQVGPCGFARRGGRCAERAGREPGGLWWRSSRR